MKKMLVVYYSWSNGNTKRIAEQLTNYRCRYCENRNNRAIQRQSCRCG